jgi:TPR repeat protein
MAKAYELTDRNRKWSPGRTKALMALVAIVTAIAVWLVPVDKQPSRPSLPSIPSAPESSEALQLPPATGTSTETSTEASMETAEELTLPPPPGGIATITNGGDQARAFIYELRANGAQPDANVVFAEAERMQGEGNLEDAYLLYRFAARNGQAQAALILGTQADPAFHSTASGYLPDPDPAQAYKWYNVASAAGNKEAAQRLQNLHKRVQQEAAAGDAQSRRLLLQWQ